MPKSLKNLKWLIKKTLQLLLLFVDDTGPYVCTRWVVKKAETAVWEKGCPALPTIKTARKAAKIIWYDWRGPSCRKTENSLCQKNPKKNYLDKTLLYLNQKNSFLNR